MEYIAKNLEELLKIPSPTGNTEKAILFVEEKFRELGAAT